MRLRSNIHDTRAAALALWVLIVLPATSRAQEIVWPVPGKTPDIMVGAEYVLETFDQFYTPMHQGTLFGGLRGSDGTYLLKVIRGKRFGSTRFQGELEAYPLLAEKLYAYVSYAYGEAPVFPKHRIGLEVFKGLPSSFEGSLGARFFSFAGNESVLLATGSLSYYYKNFMFSARPFVSVNTPKKGISGILQTRYYLSDNEEFVFGRVGAGFTPDERWIQTSQGIPGRETTLLQSQSVGGGIQSLVSGKVMFQGRLDVTRQEIVFQPGSYVLDVSIGVGFRVLL